MNVHDSERLAGVLEADGLVPADDVDDADVVVLNTCCIRENADNKLYGTLGRLSSPSAGAWPRRTGSRSRPVPRGSTPCGGPTTSGAPASSSRPPRPDPR
jgi:hypothetical protein